MRPMRIVAVRLASALAGAPAAARVEFGGEHPATLAVRITSNNAEYFRQLESAVEVKSGRTASPQKGKSQ
ncbi:MAG: hypothetical protein IT577_09775 [Verrucomicrobiae bacterium]|nr:hypothetical protein [Verrucomicrobiae bacterium]